MMVVSRLIFISQSANGFDDVVLRIGLAGINHVVDGTDSAKVRVLGFALLRRNPDLVFVGILKKSVVSEILTQQAELPQVICNVLTNVSHSPVRADNYLLVLFILRRFRIRTALHDPAALVLAFGDQRDYAFFQI